MELNRMIKECVDDSTRWFPPDSHAQAHSLANRVLCLAGEVGELANIVKKIVRGSFTLEEAKAGIGLKEPMPLEVVDILVYVCLLMGSDEFKDVDWEEVWYQKRAYNEFRFGNPSPELPKRLPYQVLAEAGIVPEKKQNWQQEGDFAS